MTTAPTEEGRAGDRSPQGGGGLARALVLAVTMSGVVLGVVAGHARWEQTRARARLARMTRHACVVQDALATTNEIKTRIERLHAHLAARSGDRPAVEASAVLRTVVARMPDDMTLDDIALRATADADGAAGAEVTGRAAAATDVDRFVAALTAVAIFADVRVTSIDDAGGVAGVVAFRLDFRVRPAPDDAASAATRASSGEEPADGA